MYNLISTISFHREVKLYWLYFILSLTIAILSFNYAISLWDDLMSTEATLNKELQDCLRQSEEYTYYLDSLEKHKSELTKNEAFTFLIEKIKYESLVEGNKVNIKFINKRISDYKDDSKKIKRYFFSILFFVLSLYILILLIFRIVRIQKKNVKIYSECQSCGRTMNTILMNYGIEKDQSMSRCFCDKCYENGQFTNISISLREMKEQVENEMKQRNFSEIQIQRKIRQLQKLERWKLFDVY